MASNLPNSTPNSNPQKSHPPDSTPQNPHRVLFYGMVDKAHTLLSRLMTKKRYKDICFVVNTYKTMGKGSDFFLKMKSHFSTKTHTTVYQWIKEYDVMTFNHSEVLVYKRKEGEPLDQCLLVSHYDRVFDDIRLIHEDIDHCKGRTLQAYTRAKFGKSIPTCIQKMFTDTCPLCVLDFSERKKHLKNMGISSKRKSKITDDNYNKKSQNISNKNEKCGKSSLTSSIFGNKDNSKEFGSIFGCHDDGNGSNIFDDEKSKNFSASVQHRREINLRMIDPIEARLKRHDNPNHKALVSSVSTTSVDTAVPIMREYGVVIVNSCGNDMVFPTGLLESLSKRSAEIENEVCDRLDEINLTWRVRVDQDVAAASSLTLEGKHSFRYQEVASRCLGRLDVKKGTNSSPFNDPDIVSNTKLMKIINSLLGNDAKLLYCGLIYSMPNSADQPWHQDGAPLFDDNQLGNVDLPSYALNVFIPLHEITQDLGPTEFFVGSHLKAQAQKINNNLSKAPSHYPIIAPSITFGDTLIYDYRTCHRGTKNLSTDKTRAMLYLIYARPWFNEHLNFGSEKLFVH